MRDHKNTKKMNFGINRNVMTLIVIRQIKRCALRQIIRRGFGA